MPQFDGEKAVGVVKRREDVLKQRGPGGVGDGCLDREGEPKDATVACSREPKAAGIVGESCVYNIRRKGKSVSMFGEKCTSDKIRCARSRVAGEKHAKSRRTEYLRRDLERPKANRLGTNCTGHGAQ